MTNKEQNTDIVSLSRLLLQKGIAFAIYRFPEEYDNHLAIQEGILSDNSGERFIITPFIESDHCKSVSLQKIDNPSLFKKLYRDIFRLPDKPVDWGLLPKEMDKTDYLNKIEQYQQCIRPQEVRKAILSRVKVIQKPQEFDPFKFYDRLTGKYPETFVNLFYLPGSGIWTGASPELLMKSENNKLHTIALAATFPRNPEGRYDWRKKEEEEHAMVRQHIESVFAKNNCDLIRHDGPYSFETGRVAHLRTDYLFEHNGHYNLQKLLAGLHPTPAVGGLPVESALACIKSYEGYSRGYYSGYLGEMNGPDYAHLFINLRCMQIGEKEIAFYIGGGISAGSEPEEEWKETIQKSLTLREMVKPTMKSMPN